MWSPSASSQQGHRQLRANRQHVDIAPPTAEEAALARKRARQHSGLQPVSVAPHRVRAPAVTQRGPATTSQSNDTNVDAMTLRWARMIHGAGRHLLSQKNSRLNYIPFAHPLLEQLIRETVFAYPDFVDANQSNINNLILFKLYSGVGAVCLRESVLATRPPLLHTVQRFYELARPLSPSLVDLQACVFPLLFHYFKHVSTDLIVSSLTETIKSEIDQLPESVIGRPEEMEEERSNIDDDIKTEKASGMPNKDILASLEMQKTLRDAHKGAAPYRGYYRYKPHGSAKYIRNPGTKLYPSTPSEMIGAILPLATQLITALLVKQYIFSDANIVEPLPPLEPDDMARCVGWLEICVLNDRHSENDTLIREFEMLTYLRYVPSGCQTSTSENYQTLYSDYNGTVAYEKAPHDLVKVCGVIVNDKLPVDEQFLPHNIKHADGVTPYRVAPKPVAGATATDDNPFVPRFVPNVGMAIHAMGSMSLVQTETQRRTAAAAERLSIRPIQPSPVQFLTAAQQQSLMDKPRVYQPLPGSTSGRPKYFDELFLAKFDEFMRQAAQIFPLRDFFIPHSMLLLSHKRLAQRYTTGTNEKHRPLFGYAGGDVWYVNDHIYDGDRYIGHRIYTTRDAPSMIHTWLSFIKYRYKSEIDCTRPIHRFIHIFVPFESDAALEEEINKNNEFWKTPGKYRMSKREQELDDREHGVYVPNNGRPWQVDLNEEDRELIRAIPTEESKHQHQHMRDNDNEDDDEM